MGFDPIEVRPLSDHGPTPVLPVNVLPAALQIPTQPRLGTLRSAADDLAGVALDGSHGRWPRRSPVAPRRIGRLSWLAAVAWLLTVLALASLTPASQRLSLLTWLVTAPGFEELFFRGVVHEGLLRSASLARTGRQRAVANGVTALLFGALHAWARDPWTGVAVVLPALVIGQYYGQQRSVLVAVAQHSVFNLAWLAWSLPALQLAATDGLARWPTTFMFLIREFLA